MKGGKTQAPQTTERMFYDLFTSTNCVLTPPVLAQWTKGQLMIVGAQGKMAEDSLAAGAKVFKDLRKAWEYHQFMKGAES